MKRKTAKGRLKRGLQSISSWCRANLHQPVAVQHQKLSQKLRGHYAYYGIIGNFACLECLPARHPADLATAVIPSWSVRATDLARVRSA